MTAAPQIVAGRVKVKRDGPRGWHWIAAEHYDPSRHELVGDEQPAPAAAIETASAATVPQQLPAAPRKRGRPRKHPLITTQQEHANHVHR